MSALSLLLCVATVALWARSYWWGDQIGWQTARRGSDVISSRGQISLLVTTLDQNNPSLPRSNPRYFESRQDSLQGTISYQPYRPNLYLSFAGFFIARAIHSSPPNPARLAGATEWGFGVPHWFLCTFTAACPASWYVSNQMQRRRTLRLHETLCLRCGYDMRATPERCPECGTAVSLKTISN